VTGTVLASLQTPQGLIVVGGPGPNVYSGSKLACVLDLGGDDTYQGQIGVILDVAGNDRHQSRGLLLLIDHAGDDQYQGGTQGAGLLKVSLQVDHAGNDRYVGKEGCQGFGMFGAGMLVDHAGDDTYEAILYAQGCGTAFGYGLLLDRAGADRYTVGGKYQSSYRTKGVFRGHGQGHGIGIRTWAGGGIGILLDSKGDDVYNAGNFSQGGGYFTGLGILEDGAGNDRYEATRYSQGFGVHSAAGILIDRGGNDRYKARIAANQGAAWDLGVGMLIDHGGDDHYQCGGLSLGGAAQNGFAAFVDLAGKDTYVGSGTVGGSGGGNSYSHGRGAGSIGWFLDLGGETDSYAPSMKRKNGTSSKNSEFGLFHDASGDLLQILADDPDIKAARQHQAQEKRAAALLVQAQGLLARKAYERAFGLLDRAAATGQTPSARGAAALVKALRADEKIQQQVAEKKMAKVCLRWLSFARSYIKADKGALARPYLKKVIAAYPESEYADDARDLLRDLD